MIGNVVTGRLVTGFLIEGALKLGALNEGFLNEVRRLCEDPLVERPLLWELRELDECDREPCELRDLDECERDEPFEPAKTSVGKAKATKAADNSVAFSKRFISVSPVLKF